MKEAPLLKLLLPFIIGILISHFIEVTITIALIFAVGSIVLLGISFVLLRVIGKCQLLNLSVIVVFISVGILVFSIHKEQVAFPGTFKSEALVFQPDDIPVTTEKWTQVRVNIKSYKSGNNWYALNKKAIIYLKNSGKLIAILPGAEYLITSKPVKVGQPETPYHFDYNNYLKNQGISGIAYVSDNQIVKVQAKSLSLWERILFFRQHLLFQVDKCGFNNEQKALVNSLVLGYRADLDSEIKSAFAIAGVMHFLSVSGLHVGIVYLFISYLLFFLKGSERILILKSIIILLGIWSYSILTGFSSPVIRSAIMFSIFEVAKLIKREGGGFNILFASALIILLFDPFQLFDVGFQLSYCAMAGIFMFYTPFNNLIYSKYKIVNIIWSTIAISMAAQLITLPLTLYYFNQFPTYFLIANILILPFSGILLSTGIIVIALSYFPVVSTFSVIALKGMLWVLVFIVSFIEKLPGSAISGIPFFIESAILMLLLVILLFVIFKTHSPVSLFSFLTVSLLFVFSISYRSIRSNSTAKIIVHNSNKGVLISIIDNNRLTAIYGNLDPNQVNKSIRPIVNKLGTFSNSITDIDSIKTRDTTLNSIFIHCLGKRNFLISLKCKKIFLLKDEKILNGMQDLICKDDVVVICKKFKMLKNQNSDPKIASALVIYQFEPERGSIESMIYKRFQKVHFLKSKGAYVADL